MRRETRSTSDHGTVDDGRPMKKLQVNNVRAVWKLQLARISYEGMCSCFTSGKPAADYIDSRTKAPAKLPTVDHNPKPSQSRARLFRLFFLLSLFSHPLPLVAVALLVSSNPEPVSAGLRSAHLHHNLCAGSVVPTCWLARAQLAELHREAGGFCFELGGCLGRVDI